MIGHVFCGGASDDISNMEWLTVAEAKAKDKADRSKEVVSDREGAAESSSPPYYSLTSQ